MLLIFEAGNALADYRLTVIPTGTGSGIVTSSPSGIDCGSDCNEDYSSGTSVTLYADPDFGSIFAGWSGGGCSGIGTCTTTINADTEITAQFEFGAIAVGDFYSLPSKFDGTLWAWGWNGYGQLGISSLYDKYSPVQVGIDNDWIRVDGGSIIVLV